MTHQTAATRPPRESGCRWRTTSTAENITTALLAHHPRDYAQMNDMLRGHYTKDANYYVHTDPWYTTRWRLDFAGSFSIWVGALLYNVSCFSGAFEVRRRCVRLRLCRQGPGRWKHKDLTTTMSSSDACICAPRLA